MSNGQRRRRIIVLGSTGSIGTQALEVIANLNRLHEAGEAVSEFEVVGLAAGQKGDAIVEQALAFGVRQIALADSNSAQLAQDAIGFAVRHGPDAAERLVREVDADIVLAAMVGSAGLPATLAAVELGRDVALANKETLVAAGALVVPEARRRLCRLLPVDSEHAALWQCLAAAYDTPHNAAPPFSTPASVERAILTASGGPFRSLSFEEVYHATPERALAHPTWNMGPKVTIDSASLTNKALELIEAHWLFGLEPERLSVLVHPQSIVHAIAQFRDGNFIAQLGAPDMRTPIQIALTHPERPEGLVKTMDLAAIGSLTFEEPDHDRFPALRLAERVIRMGGTAGATMNAANEAAVGAFLAGRIPFGRIPELTSEALDEFGASAMTCLDEAMRADRLAREFVEARVNLQPARAGATPRVAQTSETSSGSA